MTSWQFFRLAFKRWYILLAGIALTLGAAWWVQLPSGVYWSRVVVTLVAPKIENHPNPVEDPPYSLAAMAGLVATIFNGPEQPIPTASDVPLYGLGETSAHDVRVPNLGSQWVPLYVSPTIIVQVVDHSASAVEAETRRIVGRLEAILEESQAELRVESSMRVTMIATGEGAVYYVTGSPTRALGATLAVGGSATVIVVLLIERIATVRERRAVRKPVPSQQAVPSAIR